ncbi:hypothetical protein CAQU_04840 [Corynebacterium aquilae DSM 44791]|uniref:ABC-type glycine betaine transport system substrate-binding domain-containing protein n=2 Tax=Corynebacterium aquilae TaxID=203263 RepID=A0A1L7CF96_9CORY|nr:hypothetical protein CAQU_04840 [Corynebacterium aquilae DSM 44791]
MLTRPAGLLVVLGVVGGLVAGCAPEPQREVNPAQANAVRVVIDDASPKQWIVGELYMRALNNYGRDAVPYLPSEDAPSTARLEALVSGKADVVVGCTGQLLEELNPVEASRLSEEYSQAIAEGKIDPNDGTWRDKTYEALVNSLPGSLAATDPSNAVACDPESSPKLPQNVVPIYRKPVLNRKGRLIMNRVTGTISTKDVDQLAQEVERTSSVSETLGPYLRSHDLGR